MREPPDLPEEAILAALNVSHGIEVDSLAFLPVGSDSASWVYAVQAANGPAYFLKVSTRVENTASLSVPRYLCDRGIDHVVAPLWTNARTLWAGVNGFALILYPFVEGRTGADVGLASSHWRSLGALMKQVHTVPVARDIDPPVRRETYVPWRRDVVTAVETAVATRAFSEPAARDLAAFWRTRQTEIDTLVDHTDQLGRQLGRASLPLVLCHADLTPWNLLLDAETRLWVVDWDETVAAPKERDLMFVTGGIHGVTANDTAAFFEGYGETGIDRGALAYYRHARAVEDIGAYAERVFLPPTLGPETRRAAVRGFMELFEPGDIVELALSSDE